MRIMTDVCLIETENRVNKNFQRTLSRFVIQPCARIQEQVLKCFETMKLKIKSARGSTLLEIEINPNATVDELKQKFYEKSMSYNYYLFLVHCILILMLR